MERGVEKTPGSISRWDHGWSSTALVHSNSKPMIHMVFPLTSGFKGDPFPLAQYTWAKNREANRCICLKLVQRCHTGYLKRNIGHKRFKISAQPGTKNITLNRKITFTDTLVHLSLTVIEVSHVRVRHPIYTSVLSPVQRKPDLGELIQPYWERGGPLPQRDKAAT